MDARLNIEIEESLKIAAQKRALDERRSLKDIVVDAIKSYLADGKLKEDSDSDKIDMF